MNSSEILLCFGVAAGVLLSLTVGRGRSGLALILAVVAGGGFAAFYAPGATSPPGNRDGIPRIPADGLDKYVTSDTCRSCHPGEYATWHRTFHRTMTQLATPDTVVAPFDNVTLEARDRVYHLERRGDEFWVRMADPDIEHLLQRQGFDLGRIHDPPLVERRVYMTTGSHHMQGYWVKSKHGNMMRQIPWIYLIDEKKWAPRETVFLEPAEAMRHFTTWNDACLHCHAVGGKPKMDIETGTGIPTSEVAEFGISCEACHGPAAEHIAKHRNPLTRYRFHREEETDTSIVNPARLDSHRSSEVCGRCHSFSRILEPRAYVVNGTPYLPGDELEKFFEVTRYDPDLEKKARDIFWADGTCRTGGDEFNGISSSACYLKGKLSCLSCHSMHDSDPDDQLTVNRGGNEACLQCHTAFRENIEEHTHHPATSSGSLCYNCHMPFSSYALLSARRSHTIDSPSVEVSVRTGRPNACNLCHLDRTLDWAGDHLTSWYGLPQVEMDADQKQIAASLLWLYQGDAVQRGVAGWNLGWSDAHQASGTDWIAPHVSQLLDDPYAAVRFIGHRSLRSLPGFENFEFDFVAPREQRTKAMHRATVRWEQGGGAHDRDDWRTILLKSTNATASEVVERILSTRDLRPVEVAE